jgi:FkbM family methyltransferase
MKIYKTIKAIYSDFININKKWERSNKLLQSHIDDLEDLKNKQIILKDFLSGAVGSKSQYLQDLFVLRETNYKKNGFFVDFGATDGYDGSNSWLLEKQYNWSGILAEPARCWHQKLIQNRKAKIDTRCVWAKTGDVIEFKEADVAVLSTAKIFTHSDHHAEMRESGNIYNVETISLTGLLDFHNAPKAIDYLSIDTEGSELLILENFDFSKYEIKIITCEHNFSPERDKIKKLLEDKGYVRKYEYISECDDWYIKDS